MTKCHRGAVTLGWAWGLVFLCQMEKKSTHWWPHVETLAPEGPGAALALLWPHTDALADA